MSTDTVKVGVESQPYRKCNG